MFLLEARFERLELSLEDRAGRVGSARHGGWTGNHTVDCVRSRPFILVVSFDDTLDEFTTVGWNQTVTWKQCHPECRRTRLSLSHAFQEMSYTANPPIQIPLLQLNVITYHHRISSARRLEREGMKRTREDTFTAIELARPPVFRALRLLDQLDLVPRRE